MTHQVSKRKKRKTRTKKARMNRWKSERYCPVCNELKNFTFDKITGHSCCDDCGGRLMYWVRKNVSIKPKRIAVWEKKKTVLKSGTKEMESASNSQSVKE